MTTIEPKTEEDRNKIFWTLLKDCGVRFSEFGVEHPRFSFNKNPEVMEKLKKSCSNFTVISDLKMSDNKMKENGIILDEHPIGSGAFLFHAYKLKKSIENKK